MEIIECENQLQKITLADQLQTLRMFFDEESLANLRLLLIKNSITEMNYNKAKDFVVSGYATNSY